VSLKPSPLQLTERKANMPTIIEDGNDKSTKIVGVICIALLVATFVALPFMISDSNKSKEQAWQEQGCQMYDEKPMESVPAKCQSFFVDHYAPQSERSQPNGKGE
jgi:hypothetical protein